MVLPSDTDRIRNKRGGTSGAVARRSTHDEHSHHRETPDQEPERARVAPSPRLCLHDPEDDGEERDRKRHDAGRVHSFPHALATLAQRQRADRAGDYGDGDVEKEDALPRDVLDQEPADDRRAGGRQCGRRAPDADRAVELVVGKGHPQEGERVRQKERAEGSLDAAQDYDARDRIGQPDPDRGESEPDDAREEDAAAPVAVTQPPAHHQEDGQHQQIGVGDPLQVRQRGMEAALDVRVGDRHHGSVQAHHHDSEGDRDEGPPRIASHARAGASGDETFVYRGHVLPRWPGRVSTGIQAARVRWRSTGAPTRAGRSAEHPPTAGGRTVLG